MVKRFILWVLALAVSVCCGERHYVIIEVAKALESAQPGDTIIVQDGHYPDVDLHWHANATADKPVVVKALNPGKVVITGKSSLHSAARPPAVP